MSTQGGLKHVATDSSQFDNKRERRRGAAGRAAALRRAPSDSDCSGETASLSADSGDRAVRPPPPPARSGKSRSRRRGSEWEVLEGLKDGQRFDRRPEVFNGYLHKKRKWPLKGWHKRFFVVDGGILVYARSPTDVARGRLHGSVDVGLSVISAKARRRRIDIDADEFIYHLRAKTHDVFRTWLNILKAHRLYRQHLLTFGARESIPKIHAPLEDLPPTDSSARTSFSNLETATSKCSSEAVPTGCDHLNSSNFSERIACYNGSSIYKPTSQNPIQNWNCGLEKPELLPLDFEPFNDLDKTQGYNQMSLCTMKCMAQRYIDEFKENNENANRRSLYFEPEEVKWKRIENSPGVTDNDKLMNSTELHVNSHLCTDPGIQSELLHGCSLDASTLSKSSINEDVKKKCSLFFDRKRDASTDYYFFTLKKANERNNSPVKSTIRKSKKCTNVVKYRNIIDEPPLRKSLNRSMLLGKYKIMQLSKHTSSDRYRGPEKKVNDEIQVQIENKKSKSQQDTMTASEYDKIIEKLMMTIFQHHNNTNDVNSTSEIKHCIDQIVKELYETKWSTNEARPVRALFRGLLEYWLKNTSVVGLKGAVKRVKSIGRQSNKHFTKDVNLSNVIISKGTKQTQINALGQSYAKEIRNPRYEIKLPNPKHITESYEKERRVQELERLLKNTVYICETVCGSQSKEKDINITRRLIDNLEKLSKKSKLESDENSNSSTEFPKIKETINRLISETSIPPVVAKELLGAYLDVLLNESSKNDNESSSPSTDSSKPSEIQPRCDVVAESVQKKVSKGVTIFKSHDSKDSNNNVPTVDKPQIVDPGQLYLKDILDKITTMFTRAKKSLSNSTSKDMKERDKKTDEANKQRRDLQMKDELGRAVNEYPGKDLISENLNENSVVIDLSKYDLEHISMFSDPSIKGTMSISIKLKEKPLNFGEAKRTNLNLKFSDDNAKPIISEVNNKWLHSNISSANNLVLPRRSFKNPYLDFNPNTHGTEDLKRNLSSSDATSKAFCRIIHESQHSLNFSIPSINSFPKDWSDSKNSIDSNDEPQSCYLMSFFKKNPLPTKIQARMSRGKDLHEPNLDNRTESINKNTDLTIFDASAPKIIDEKFILLMLENLMQLSLTVPGLHKDIQGLYLKLRKRHEKLMKNTTNSQGLSLLGKIYNEENRLTGDNETHFDKSVCRDCRCGAHEKVSVNTSTNDLPVANNCVDKSISTIIMNNTKCCEVQTETEQLKKNCNDIFDNNKTEDAARHANLTNSSKYPQYFEFATPNYAKCFKRETVIFNPKSIENSYINEETDLNKCQMYEHSSPNAFKWDADTYTLKLPVQIGAKIDQVETEIKTTDFSDDILKPPCFKWDLDNYTLNIIQQTSDKRDTDGTIIKCTEASSPTTDLFRTYADGTWLKKDPVRCPLNEVEKINFKRQSNTQSASENASHEADKSKAVCNSGLKKDVANFILKVDEQNGYKNNIDSKKLNVIRDLSKSAHKSFQNGTSNISRKLETQKTSIITVNSLEKVATTELAISSSNWYQDIGTKDCSLNTTIKRLLDRHKYFENDNKVTTNVKTHSHQTRQDLVKELKLLSSSIKESTHYHMEKNFERHKIEKDFNVYQFVKCNEPMKSVSVIDSCAVLREPSDEWRTIYRCRSDPSYCSGLLSPTSPPIRGPQAGFVSGTPGGRLASWIIESGGPLENASRELGQAQLSVQQLQRLLDALELQHHHHHDTDVSMEGASPNVKKDRRKFGLRKKKSNSKCASVDLGPTLHIDPSSSHLALSALTAPPSPGGGASSMPNSAASLPIACAAARPQSLPGAESLGAAAGPASLTSLTPDQQLREDFTVLAKDLLNTLKGVVTTLVCERGRLRAAMDAAETTATPGGVMVAALRTNLTSALQQNSELRTRLSRIHDASDIADVSSINNSDPQVNRAFHQQSLSYSSSCVSASEFFDAEEHEDHKPSEILQADEAGVIELDGDSSSEAGSLSSEEGSASSDNSDGAMLSAEQLTLRMNQNGVEPHSWTRRTLLPRPRPTPGGPSLWNLLYKNIGKDLSQISMPVTINEPLNMLQRLCEELEYSELLDNASECASAVERMALVAAFAVSAYAGSAHRAASKPFNPLLAETYECVRGDRGFRFLAEQVSHHPPISACHAESSRWVFWQEARIKTKFWGKSMEFQPTGRVHVRLANTGDHYSWNKVTTCVHNLFGGQRWVDQYGDMHIICHGTDISCKLNFIKASSWSSGRHEVRGAVTQTSSGTRLRLQGRWSEALYAGEPPAARCLWRPGAMPPEHQLYYGFTRFAMELNELEPGMKELLPHTDTRLRPDQRALEAGDVEAAEQYKHELEQTQRDRRRDSPDHVPAWFRKAVEGGEETWVFTGEYWKAREAGFSDDVAPRIW